MALPNKISHTITDDDVKKFCDDLNAIYANNPFLDVSLPDLDDVRTIGPEREPYVERVIKVWKLYSAKISAEYSITEAERDYDVYKKVNIIIPMYLNHVTKLEQIGIAAGNDTLSTIDKVYEHLKVAAKSDTALEYALKEVQEITKTKKTPPPVNPPAPTP